LDILSHGEILKQLKDGINEAIRDGTHADNMEVAEVAVLCSVLMGW